MPIFDELSEGAGTEIKILMLGCGNSALSEAVRLFPRDQDSELMSSGDMV